jgi:hypothetical protein
MREFDRRIAKEHLCRSKYHQIGHDTVGNLKDRHSRVETGYDTSPFQHFEELKGFRGQVLNLDGELSSEVVDEGERRRTLLGEVEQSTPKPRWQPGERYATHVEGYHHQSGGADR